MWINREQTYKLSKKKKRIELSDKRLNKNLKDRPSIRTGKGETKTELKSGGRRGRKKKLSNPEGTQKWERYLRDKDGYFYNAMGKTGDARETYQGNGKKCSTGADAANETWSASPQEGAWPGGGGSNGGKSAKGRYRKQKR